MPRPSRFSSACMPSAGGEGTAGGLGSQGFPGRGTAGVAAFRQGWAIPEGLTSSAGIPRGPRPLLGHAPAS